MDPRSRLHRSHVDVLLVLQGSKEEHYSVKLPSLDNFNFQIWGAAVKDSHLAAFAAQAGGYWDSSKTFAFSVLTGTALATGKQVALLVPEPLLKGVVELCASTQPLTVMRVKGAREIPPMANFSSYQAFLLATAPAPARPAPETRILSTIFQGPPMNLTQATALVNSGRVVTLAGYMPEAVESFQGSGPGRATLYLEGDRNQEVEIKIWGENHKAAAAASLPVGPVAFDVTVRRGTYGSSPRNHNTSAVEFHCNVPHFGTPLGPPLGLLYTTRAESWPNEEMPVVITAYSLVQDETDMVVGIVLRLAGVDGSDEGCAVVKSDGVAFLIFGSLMGVGTEVFEWLTQLDTNIEVLSAFGVKGKIEKGPIDAQTGEVTLVGFKAM